MQLQPPVPCQPPSAVEPISDMHIYVVTPAFNAVQTINRTINSVISQSGDFTIHYHVQDGGSSDGTVELLQQWQHTLAQGLLPLSCRAVHFSYASTPDSGMYDAIQRGFARFALQPKHWITWINSDDLILPDSFSFIANIDKSPGLADSVNWVTGEAMILRNGSLFRCSRRALNADFVRAGLADGISAPFIQQEGTFFRAGLWQQYQAQALDGFRYAGDWSLWKHFAKTETLYCADMPLGVFTSRNEQLSKKFWHQYMLEIFRHNDYQHSASYGKTYKKAYANLNDGVIYSRRKPSKIRIDNNQNTQLYADVERCVAAGHINTNFRCNRLFIFGYSGFANHLLKIIRNQGKAADAILVSKKEFTDSTADNVLTLQEAKPDAGDVIIMTSFKNKKVLGILQKHAAQAQILHWTALVPFVAD